MGASSQPKFRPLRHSAGLPTGLPAPPPRGRPSLSRLPPALRGSSGSNSKRLHCSQSERAPCRCNCPPPTVCTRPPSQRPSRRCAQALRPATSPPLIRTARRTGVPRSPYPRHRVICRGASPPARAALPTISDHRRQSLSAHARLTFEAGLMVEASARPTALCGAIASNHTPSSWPKTRPALCSVELRSTRPPERPRRRRRASHHDDGRHPDRRATAFWGGALCACPDAPARLRMDVPTHRRPR